MNNRLDNWVFLGDSLVEGVGSSRVSFVSEFVKQLRHNHVNSNSCSISYIRLKQVDPNSFDRFVTFNLMGFQDIESNNTQNQLVIWNLGAEGTTIDTDHKWLPLINILRPSRIIMFRGSLESIVRPGYYFDGQWPWWVPKSWRGLVSMDPRCYYSTTWWRKTKQWLIDRIKQHVRLKLLKNHTGKSLQEPEMLVKNYQKALQQLEPLGTKITICGLLPVSEKIFPRSSANFHVVNNLLGSLSKEQNVEFLDWGDSPLIKEKKQSIFYQDGFHPNKKGSAVLANLLINSIFGNSLNGS